MKTRKVEKNAKAWAFIMKTSPDILGTNHELDLSDLPRLANTEFEEVIAIIMQGMVKENFRLNLSDQQSYNFLSYQHVELISSALSSGCCPKNFHLDLCFSLYTHTAKKLTSLASAIQSGHCPEGFTLNLANNGLIELVHHFKNSFAACPKNFKINLALNKLTDDDILILAEELTASKGKLAMLDLSHNQITNNGALMLYAAIHNKDYSNLQIKLNGNMIDPEILSNIQSELNRAPYACAMIQQGIRQQNSVISKLPQSVANHMYQFLISESCSQKILFFEKKLKEKMHGHKSGKLNNPEIPIKKPGKKKGCLVM